MTPTPPTEPALDLEALGRVKAFLSYATKYAGGVTLGDQPHQNLTYADLLALIAKIEELQARHADDLQGVVAALYKAWPDAEDIASDWPLGVIGSIEQIIRERDEALSRLPEGGGESSAGAESMCDGALPIAPEPPLSAGAWRPWKAPDRYDIWPCEKDDIVDLRFSGPVMEATEHFAQRADNWDWTTNGEPLVTAWRPHNPAESSPSGAQRSELEPQAPDALKTPSDGGEK